MSREERKVEITMNENKFTLCHIGEIVNTIEKVYPNDAEFGKEVRRIIKSNRSTDSND